MTSSVSIDGGDSWYHELYRADQRPSVVDPVRQTGT